MTDEPKGVELARETSFLLSSNAMCVVDRRGRILGANQAFSRCIGSDDTWSIASIPSTIDGTEAMERSLRELEESALVALRTSVKSGRTVRIFEWKLQAVDDVILAELEDVTRRVALRDEYDALLRALPDIYFRLDAEGRIEAFHAARHAEFHVPPERFIGQRVQEILPPELSATISEVVDRVRTKRVPGQVEYSLPTPSGDDQFEASLVPCGASQVTILIRNTTARRRAEAALRSTEERLRATQMLDAIGQLAGGVAHDFNNALGVIIGRLGFLGRAKGFEEREREHVREALDAASHAASLTRQLLAFGRRQKMKSSVFDLNGVIGSMSDVLVRTLGEDVEVDLTLATEVCAITSDPVQIEQVVLNLALNARYAMADNGKLAIATSVSILDEGAADAQARVPGPYVTLTVSDTGCGMSQDVKAHLFEPFFTTKPRDEGTGLGLATVYGIVKQSSGHIVVRSDVGIGTTFEISFPLADENLLSDEGASPHARSSADARSVRT